MRPRYLIPIVLTLIPSLTFADDKAPLPKMSKDTRFKVIRGLNAELVYIRAPFPMGEKGLKLKNGVLTPNGKELEMLMATFGPATKPGEQARISNVVIKDKSIIFEVNGGPRKKRKWYERITVGGAGGEVPVAPSDADANPRGSMVELQFDKYVPDLTIPDLKTMLRPVFDFDAKSAVESYLETVPPKVKEAIQKHDVLVGMNREMVTYAKGKPPKKIREKEGEQEYEEWIYGEPPADVQFIRLVGDEVTQVKIMSIDGKKIVRTEKEIDLTRAPGEEVAKTTEKPSDLPGKKPTLRRPGEPEVDDSGTKVGVSPRRVGDPPNPPQDPNGPPPNFLQGQ